MAIKPSYSSLTEYLPKKESFQNLLASLPPVLIVSYFAAKINSCKQASECHDFSSTTPPQKASLFSYVILEKFSSYMAVAHSAVFVKSENKFVENRQYDSHLDQNKFELDPDDFFHAVKNSHTNVPKCCVEPYILSGYVLNHRPWSYYLKVLYIPNNEALNVWTHLVPSFYFMWMLYSFNQTIDLLTAWPLLFITVSAIVLTLFSAVAHMFHSRSSYHHCCLFILDYFGITIFAFSSTTAHFFASSELSFYARVGWYNLLVLTIICSIGFYLCSYSQTGRTLSNTRHRHFKLFANGFGYLYGVLPIGHRFLTSDGEDPAMMYHLLQLFFFLSSPAWYASDMPQKCWPGKFDIVGHSHQIFHIFGALACYFDILAVHLDVTSGKWTQLHSQVDYPSATVVCICVLLLALFCLLVGIYFSRRLKHFFQEELDAIFRCQCKTVNFYTGDVTDCALKKDY